MEFFFFFFKLHGKKQIIVVCFTRDYYFSFSLNYMFNVLLSSFFVVYWMDHIHKI